MMNIEQDITGAKTLPGSFYNSPETLEKCREKLFMRSWQWIGDRNEVKLPQHAFPFHFMENFIEEPLLLINDDKDQLHCVSNVCTHRGNILVDHPGPIGNNIICGYHGRRFKCNGKFVSMPECDGMKNFPTERDDLPALEVKNWKQFLFTSVNPGFSFEEMVKDMDERVGWMPVEEFIFDETRSQDYLVKANWALYCDNYLEGFHIPFIHKELAKALDYGSYKSELYPYSNLQLGVGRSGDSVFNLPKGHIDEGQKIAAYYFWLFPNMMFNFYPWGLSLNIIRPIQYNLTRVSFRTYVWDASKMNLGAGADLDRVEREDEAIVEKVQKGTNSYLYNAGRFSPKMEKGVHHFHRLISEFIN